MVRILVLIALILSGGILLRQSVAQSNANEFSYPPTQPVCNQTDVPVRAAFKRTKYGGFAYTAKYEEVLGWWIIAPGRCINAPTVESCNTDWVGNRSNCVQSTVYYAEVAEGRVGWGALIGRWGESDTSRMCVSRQQSFTYDGALAGPGESPDCTALGGISVPVSFAGGDWNTTTSVGLTADAPSLKAELGGNLLGPEWEIGACDKTYESVSGYDRISCTCPAQTTATGEIDGAYVYTARSSICTAALHAGAVGTSGGTVTLLLVNDHPGGPSLAQNGITSFPVGLIKTGFRFEGPTLEATNPIRADACPLDALSMPRGANTCYCYPDQGKYFKIWGWDGYSAASNICRAAIHAGVLAPGGGMVTVNVTQGVIYYNSETQNGVSSSSSGAGYFNERGPGYSFNTLPGSAPACPATGEGLAVGTEMTCFCSSERASGSGVVYGGKGGGFGDQSDICRAAVHAGAASAEAGGLVKITVSAGRNSNEATVRAGVTTQPTARRPSTLYVEPVSSPPEGEMAARLAAYVDRLAESLGYTLLPEPGQPLTETPSSCPESPSVLKDTTRPIICSCSYGKSDYPSVWGGADGVYSDNSRVCEAAFHAGVIGGDGGLVIFTPSAPRASYKGVRRNGISSRDDDGAALSFTVASGQAFFAPRTTSAVPASTAALSPAASQPLSACPKDAKNLKSMGGSIACECAKDWRRGTVWGGGSGVYTDDSSICQAALHAGVIDADGGPVLVTAVEGLSAYSGSTANGVTTKSYGPWAGSFRVSTP